MPAETPRPIITPEVALRRSRSATPWPRDTALDLDYSSISALTLNGGTINGAAVNNAATLTLPAPVTDGLAAKNIVVDSTPPTASVAAGATPNPVTGTTASLSVLGADVDTGEGSLKYNWQATTIPSGAAAPTLSANGSNAAKNTTATFSVAGNYAFTVTITDPSGLTGTSSVAVTVNQTPTTLAVSPTSANFLGCADAAVQRHGQGPVRQPVDRAAGRCLDDKLRHD